VGIDALFHKDDGTRDVATTPQEWSSWVSASHTRNVFLEDPLLDWLAMHGEAKGFAKDPVDPRVDFGRFVMDKGIAFERAVIAHLSKRCDVVPVGTGARGEARDEALARRTWDLLRAGTEAVAQAPLWNPQTRTYGVADLLVRSDVLERLFPGTLADAAVPAPDLGPAPWHYRVIDVKFTTLDLLRDGHAASGHLAYAAQVWLYNEALGRLQGFAPPCGYLLGRAWKRLKERGTSALDRVCRVDRAHVRRSGETLGDLALAACDWVRRLRRDGARWDVLPSPTVRELRPNMRNTRDAPWHGAKKRIADALDEPTTVPRVGPAERDAALAAGLRGWRDADCSAASLGVNGPTFGAQVDAVLAANRSPPDGPIVFPARVTVDPSIWRDPAPVEFYVDFENVSDLDDDFSSFPEKGGRPCIYMVGCGSFEPSGEWRFEVFTADRLAPDDERRVLDAWLAHMRARCARSGTDLSTARIFCWSPAEDGRLESDYNSAAVRHGLPTWNDLPWVDLLSDVVRAQPVTVRGAFGFGLKAVTNAMHAAGLIGTAWPPGVADGMGALVGGWWCDGEARSRGCSMRDLPLMREIQEYNRVDVEAMRDVLDWLRRNR
jgi:hypothetical protein